MIDSDKKIELHNDQQNDDMKSLKEQLANRYAIVEREIMYLKQRRKVIKLIIQSAFSMNGL